MESIDLWETCEADIKFNIFISLCKHNLTNHIKLQLQYMGHTVTYVITPYQYNWMQL